MGMMDESWTLTRAWSHQELTPSRRMHPGRVRLRVDTHCELIWCRDYTLIVSPAYLCLLVCLHTVQRRICWLEAGWRQLPKRLGERLRSKLSLRCCLMGCAGDEMLPFRWCSYVARKTVICRQKRFLILNINVIIIILYNGVLPKKVLIYCPHEMCLAPLESTKT